MTSAADGPRRVRRRVIYRGRVQGVGFRYNTCGIARRFAVAGFVKNMRDGTVELAVDGMIDVVNAFLEAVAESFRDHIDSIDSEDLTSNESFRDFGVRY